MTGKQSDNDIEALAAGKLPSPMGSLNLEYLDDKDNADAAGTIASPSITPATDIHDDDDYDGSDRSYDDDGDDESYRSSDEEDGHHNNQLATIPEDGGSFSPTSGSNNNWPRHSSDLGLGYGDHYYDSWKGDARYYRFSFWKKHRFCCFINMASVCGITFLAFVLMKKYKEIAPSYDTEDNVASILEQQLKQDSYKAIYDSMSPVWYDRSKGWNGKTYDEAFKFCSSVSYGRHHLCPYSAYCPKGKGSVPFEGYKDDYSKGSYLGQWAPIQNPANEWVQVANNEDVCEIYSNLYGPWDKRINDDGELLEVITRNIACCLTPGSDGKPQQDGGYPSDIYNRPPLLEEDDLSNHPEVLEFQMTQNAIDEVLQPLWFSNTNGWVGSSYEEGVSFCKSMSGSRTVCPYEAYCPGGPHMPPFQSVQGNGVEAEWLAPVWADQPRWVGVGALNVCIQRGVLEDADVPKVKYILCCLDGKSGGSSSAEQKQNNPQNTGAGLSFGSVQSSGPKSELDPKQTPQPPANNDGTQGPQPTGNEIILTENEQAVMEYMNPLWYGRKDGYIGSTHEEAVDFCKSVGNRELCLGIAYCPNGSRVGADVIMGYTQPLFLRMDPFPREQWAPILSSNASNSWIMVGTIGGSPSSTCRTYEELHDGEQPDWGMDGSHTELKEHILCCLPEKQQEVQNRSGDTIDHLENSSSSEATEEVTTTKNEVVVGQRLWFTRGDWKYHTYEIAREYCSTKIKHGFLCPYDAVCPDGAANPPFAPPMMNSEQWIAINGKPDHAEETWVLVGQSEEENNGDDGTGRLCHTHDELYGHDAEDVEQEEKTQFILCCGPVV